MDVLSGVDALVLPGERGERRHRELTARGEIDVDPAAWRLLSGLTES